MVNENCLTFIYILRLRLKSRNTHISGSATLTMSKSLIEPALV